MVHLGSCIHWAFPTSSQPQGNKRALSAVFSIVRRPPMAQAARKKSSKDYEAKRTTDQDEIRLWAERRGGHPAMVEGTDILRIDFDEPDDGKDEALRRVTW